MDKNSNNDEFSLIKRFYPQGLNFKDEINFFEF